jgi:hypothetical protein
MKKLRRRLLISALILGVLLLALGGWSVRGTRRLLAVRPAPAPRPRPAAAAAR